MVITDITDITDNMAMLSITPIKLLLILLMVDSKMLQLEDSSIVIMDFILLQELLMVILTQEDLLEVITDYQVYQLEIINLLSLLMDGLSLI